ncbi:MAG TPA: type II toxin-antitoxin system VapC family toxin [Opitutaceae bacterium]|nr:type II toxin-antitoxin system VapC family toxin [Opitutaceae bacterium]
MNALVIDGSTTIGFLLKDEQGVAPLKALEAIENGVVTFVPAHWSVEVANGLIMAERRKRASQADITEALALVAALPVEYDDETTQRAVSDTAALARQYGLTIYDAAYLELAMRRGASLASTDAALCKAAKTAGVRIFN